MGVVASGCGNLAAAHIMSRVFLTDGEERSIGVFLRRYANDIRFAWNSNVDEFNSSDVVNEVSRCRKTVRVKVS